MNTNFKSTSKSCLQSYILPSLTGLRATLLPLGGRRGWGRVCFFLLSLLLFAACSSDNDEQVQQPQPEKSYPLTIEVTENPMTGDGEKSSNRAAITDNSSLASFKMDYTYGTSSCSESSFTASKDTEGKWTSTATWPSSAVSPGTTEVTWHAYTDGAFNYNNGTPYINFSVDELATGQKDVLVATAIETYNNTYDSNTETCKFSYTFNHACSAVRFLVKKSSNLVTPTPYTVNISSIKLCNVVKQGKYYFGTSTWELADTRTEWTLTSDPLINLGSESYVNLNAADDYLFMIPQALTAWDTTTDIASAITQSYLEIECNVYQGSTKVFPTTSATYGTAYIPFGTANEKPFLKGKKHEVKINIGKNSLYSGPGTKIIPAS